MRPVRLLGRSSGGSRSPVTLIWPPVVSVLFRYSLSALPSYAYRLGYRGRVHGARLGRQDQPWIGLPLPAMSSRRRRMRSAKGGHPSLAGASRRLLPSPTIVRPTSYLRGTEGAAPLIGQGAAPSRQQDQERTKNNKERQPIQNIQSTRTTSTTTTTKDTS